MKKISSSEKSFFFIIFIIFNISFFHLLISGYKFGVGDGVAHLSYIFKKNNDIFFNSDPLFSNLIFFGPFQYFYKFISIFLNVFNPSIFFFILTILNNFILSVLLFFIIRHFKINIYLSLLCLICMLSIEPYDLGGGGWIISDNFKPSLIARMFSYGSILLALKNKPIFSYILLIIGSFIHPTLCALTGCIILLIAIVNNINLNIYLFKISSNDIKKLFFNFFIFLFFFIIIIIIWNKNDLSILEEKEYIDILDWRIGTSVNILKFSTKAIYSYLILSIIYLLLIFNLKNNKKIENKIFNICFFLYIFTFFVSWSSYLFINILENKLFFQLYLFRLVFINKILFFILIFYYIQNKVIGNRITNFQFFSILLFFLIFGLVCFLLGYSRPDILIMLFLYVYVIFILSRKFNLILYSITFFLFIYLFIDLYKKTNKFDIIYKQKIPIVYFAPGKKFYSDIFTSDFKEKFKLISNFFKNEQNSFTFRYYENFKELNSEIKNNSNKDDLYLAPLDIAHKLRLSSKTSIFVDMKVVPYNSKQLFLWWKRLNSLVPFEELKISKSEEIKIKKYYINLNDNKLDKLKKKYNINKAILYLKTMTKKQIIYQDKYYKIVQL